MHLAILLSDPKILVRLLDAQNLSINKLSKSKGLVVNIAERSAKELRT